MSGDNQQERQENKPYLEVCREQYGCVDARVIIMHLGGDESVRIDIYSKGNDHTPINFLRTDKINDLAQRLAHSLGIEVKLMNR